MKIDFIFGIINIKKLIKINIICSASIITEERKAFLQMNL